MKVVCPGSYDPITMGHLDIIARSAAMFAEVVVAVVHNPSKRGRFDPETRRELITASIAADERTKDAANITIDLVAGGLLVDYCRDIGAPAVVKGLRSGTDFAYELPMALMNKHLTELETLFVPGSPEFEHVSSSLIKEVHANGGDIAGLVPEPVFTALQSTTPARPRSQHQVEPQRQPGPQHQVEPQHQAGPQRQPEPPHEPGRN